MPKRLARTGVAGWTSTTPMRLINRAPGLTRSLKSLRAAGIAPPWMQKNRVQVAMIEKRLTPAVHLVARERPKKNESHLGKPKKQVPTPHPCSAQTGLDSASRRARLRAVPPPRHRADALREGLVSSQRSAARRHGRSR